MPVVAAPGSAEDLSAMLDNSFGASSDWNSFWVTYYGAQQLTTWDFRYWNLSDPEVAKWYVNGSDIGPGFANQAYVPGSSLSSAQFYAGNDIGPLAYVTVPIEGSPGSYGDYIQYSAITINPALISPTAGRGQPTPQDIVNTAHNFASFYGQVPNDNDCHYIASEVAAAAGATLTDETQSLDPTQNQDGGFWRIVYRGSDPNPVTDWQTLVQPGDIVRMGWIGGGQHTTTVLAVNPDGSLVVYDNDDYTSQGTEVIGVHTVNYYKNTIPSTITIYRLTTDGLYLEQADAPGESIPGTIFNDHIVAGGRDDTAVYSALSATQATITRSAGGDVTVAMPKTTDLLTNMDWVQFANTTVWVGRAAEDFNNSGQSDVLFRNTSGLTYLWWMNGATVTNGAPTSLQANANWQIQGIGDFDNSGAADILWRYDDAANASDPLNGVTYVSLQNGATATSASAPTSWQVDESWQVQGVGDFDGNGAADILWRNSSTGQTYLWEMNGTQVSSGSFTSGQVTDPNWQVAGIGDFAGDGHSDILWRYDNASNASDPLNGDLYLWMMNGATVTSATALGDPGANWQVAGTGDFDGNGTADILFRYNNAANASDPLNGTTYIDFMNGSTVTSGAPTQWQVDNSWVLADIGDFNGNGRSDILWQQSSTGNAYIWEMNGANVISGSPTSEQAGVGWTVQNGKLIG